MTLVDRAVHSDGDAQLFCRFVVPDLSHHRRQGGGAQVCGPGGNDLANPVSGGAVFSGRVQAQDAECLLGASQTFFFSAGKESDVQFISDQIPQARTEIQGEKDFTCK